MAVRRQTRKISAIQMQNFSVVPRADDPRRQMPVTLHERKLSDVVPRHYELAAAKI